jgi:hypothetical protein
VQLGGAVAAFGAKASSKAREVAVPRAQPGDGRRSDPRRVGIYPTEMGKKLNAIYFGDEPWGGRKINAFYGAQLLDHPRSARCVWPFRLSRASVSAGAKIPH